MTNCIAIELNDTGVIVYDGVSIVENSPGYIVEFPDKAWIGKEARERAFLFPNECDYSFWSQTAAASERSVNQRMVDLTLCHLGRVWQQHAPGVSEVVLVVPGSYTKTGLGLLLGICNELKIPVHAMVHQAVLSPWQQSFNGDTVHIDIQLQRTVVTRLNRTAEDFTVDSDIVINTGGVVSLYDQAAEAVAKEFIRKTRLDPTHSAELEQQLHKHLPAWLQAAQHSETVVCQLHYQQNTFDVELPAQVLHSACAPQINQILRTVKSTGVSEDVILCLPAWFDSQFGFTRYAHNENMRVRLLATGHYAQQCFSHKEAIATHDGQVYLIKQLPCTVVQDDLSEPAGTLHNKATPDYVLFQSHAHPINPVLVLRRNEMNVLELDTSDSEIDDIVATIRNDNADVLLEVNEQHRILVNGQLVQSVCKLNLGDSIGLIGSDAALALIKVQSA